MAEAHEEHGHTPAAWTAVIIMIVGFLVGAVGVILATPWVSFVGVGIVVVGVVVGKVMQTMGYGKVSLGPVDDQSPLDHEP
jgi:hypothetical protein